MAPFLLENVTWHRNCVGSNAFPESGLLGTGSRAGTAADHLFPGDSSQEQTCLSKQLVATAACPAVASLKRGYRPENLVWFVSLLPAAVCLCTVCWEKDLGALRRGVSGSELQGRQVVLAGSVPALLWGSLLQLGYRDVMALGLQVAERGGHHRQLYEQILVSKAE